MKKCMSSKETVNELRSKMSSTDTTNIEYMDAALKLRDLILETEGRDIFLPPGSDVLTEENRQTSEKAAEAFRYCLYVDNIVTETRLKEKKQ